MSVSEHQQKAIQNSDKNQRLRDNTWLLRTITTSVNCHSQMLLIMTKVIL